MTAAPQKAPKPPRTARQKAQLALSSIVLLSILFLVYKSWRSSQTLAFGLTGTWTSVQGEFSVSCEGGGQYASVCQFSSPLSYSGEVLVTPLSDGSWTCKLPREDAGGSYFLHHTRGRLGILGWEERGRAAKSKMIVFRRANETHRGNFWAALKAKSQYIVPLFILVVSYKWIQTAFFGNERGSLPRRQRLIGRRRTAASR